jgi:hypothetical protein
MFNPEKGGNFQSPNLDHIQNHGIIPTRFFSGACDVDVRLGMERNSRKWTADFLNNGSVVIEMPTVYRTSLENLCREVSPRFKQQFGDEGIYVPTAFYDEKSRLIEDPKAPVDVWIFAEYPLVRGVDYLPGPQGINFREVNQLRVRAAGEMIEVLKGRFSRYEAAVGEYLDSHQAARTQSRTPVSTNEIAASREQAASLFKIVTIEKRRKKWFGYEKGRLEFILRGEPGDEQRLQEEIDRIQSEGWECNLSFSDFKE